LTALLLYISVVLEVLNMKVKHTQGTAYWLGRTHDTVYFPAPNETFSLSRLRVMPLLTANNHMKGTIMKNLASVWRLANGDYRTDWGTYAKRYSAENQTLPNLKLPPNNGFAWFVQAMWNWYHSDELHIDLTTITVADIVTMDADIRTVQTTVSMMWVPMISLYSDLSADIS
jgi:hypothetical protein